MGGIYIPNMEMPKTCFSCSFNDGLFCSLIDDDADALLSDNPVEEISTRRLDACPLIEIPTPHGRLIAEGSITDQLQEIEDITALSNIDLGEEPYDDTDEIMLPISTIRKILDRCITILEAEE